MPKEKPTYIRIGIGCFLICALSQGSFLVSYSLNLTTWIEELGISTIAATSTNAAASLVAAVINIWFAKHIIRKIGIRKSFYLAGVAAAVSYCIYGFMQNFTVFLIGAFISGFVAVFGGMAFISSCINNWFFKEVKTVMSTMAASISCGAMFVSFMLGRLNIAYGWRNGMFILAAVVSVGMILVARFLVVDSPEKAGVKPYGYEELKAGQETASEEADVYGVTENVARKTPLYWILLFSILFLTLLTGATGVYVMPLWQSTGMSVIQSANFVSIFNIFVVIGIIVFGFIAGRFNLYKVIVAGLALGLAGAGVIVYLGGAGALASPYIAYLMFLLVAGVISLASTYATYVVQDVFGRKYFSDIIGTFTGLNLLGGIINSPIFGTLVDFTGSYTSAWWVVIGFGCVSLVLAVAVAVLSKSTKDKLSKTLI